VIPTRYGMSLYLNHFPGQDTPQRHTLVPGLVAGVPALWGAVLESGYSYVATDDGWLYRFSESLVPGQHPLWSQLYADGQSSNALDASLLGPVSQPPAELMPASRAYFYPSPVGNTQGKLRFYLSAKADVAVRIYTSVGELVWETRLDAAQTTAQADNEITWPGGTKFASGLYLCRIVATSDDGRRSAATIPVGVAR